jgi:coenzyme F420-dependent glucose-6-phosphate dehydrogenase
MPDTDTQFWFAASTEEFMPTEMLEQARAAEEAGFDGTATSDHWAPWFPDGRGSSAWAFLGAAGQHTTGRETVTIEGGWFRLNEAKLYSRSKTRPKLYVSAFGKHAVEIAAKYGDGLWTLGDPEQAPEIIDAWKEARGRLGKDQGEIILQSGFHLGPDERSAIQSSRKWKPTQLPEVYTDDIHDPAEMVRMADEKMSDEEFAHEGFLVGGDPDEHVERLREMLGLGPTVVCLQGIGDADPLGSIRRYGAEVLPALRGARV